MSRNPDPELPDEALLRYVLGELGPEEARAFEGRLAGDPALAAEAAALRRTWEMMPYAAVTQPPAHLRARVLRAVGAGKRPLRFSGLTWSRALAAAAGVIAVVIAMDDQRLRRELRLQGEANEMLQQPNVVLSFALRGTGAAAAAAGTVLLDLDAAKAAVAIEKLPPPPAGREYRLWAVVEGKQIYCGQLGVNSAGMVLSQLRIPVESYTAPISKLHVTLEALDAPLVPSGPTVLASG